MRVDICVPIYNEEKVIAQNAQRILDYCEDSLSYCDWRVVLVINGTTDGSAKLACELEKIHERLLYVEYQDSGKGQALHRYWHESSADILVGMDSDLAVSLHALTPLIKPLINNQADLSIGSRYLPDSKVHRSLMREIISRVFNYLAHILLHNPQKDLQCGFKALTKSTFTLLEHRATNKDWFFDTELISWANLLNLRIIEIPVDWREGRFDRRRSTVHFLKIIQDFILPMLTLRKIMKRYKSSL